jgi:site-specific DNA-methyltransferase (adenine-specific)
MLEFPETKSGKMNQRVEGGTFNVWGKQYPRDVETIGDAGSASRFFQHCDWEPGEQESASSIFYCAKAGKKERNAGLSEGDNSLPKKNIHPTVKPLALMKYLCRLICPPGGIILDPFCGSGTTGCAAVLEGFSFAGIDQSPEYCDIARARIQYALEHATVEDEEESETEEEQG